MGIEGDGVFTPRQIDDTVGRIAFARIHLLYEAVGVCIFKYGSCPAHAELIALESTFRAAMFHFQLESETLIVLCQAGRCSGFIRQMSHSLLLFVLIKPSDAHVARLHSITPLSDRLGTRISHCSELAPLSKRAALNTLVAHFFFVNRTCAEHFRHR